ncbi:UPF0223 family protein [Lederbergia sp. NSJ-179]|uniref:UPF0223 family protein n=1 Tax=Lederbergia sp. NSJ-179 TaxID=2931402 RepID=UPI001FD51931|nr:UPF0223 family protein [Lederbergia sp. NSJ-179]MCJ7843276.1 UPF0223 family protein [Lederbergia sp. NSJ-179]
MEYEYPFSIDWSKDEIMIVIHFFQTIEQAYERGAYRDDILTEYRKFKQIVPSKSEERRYGKEFELSSGYSLYKTIENAKSCASNQYIKM